MSAEVAAIVLGTAVIHALWNALVKSSADPLLAQWGIVLGGGLFSVALLPFFPIPDPASWPWLAAAIVVHVAYNLSLAEAYRLGDLSQVYPIARGSAPLGVAAFAALVVGERLDAGDLAGILAISLGIGALASSRGSPRAIATALGVGALISAYTTLDGVGARRAGNPISYVLWLNVIDTLPVLPVVLWRRPGQMGPYLRSASGRRAIFGGVMSIIAYGAIAWAYTRAPLATVSALRETSVVFAALIGAVTLREGFGPRRVTAACLVAAGAAWIQLGG